MHSWVHMEVKEILRVQNQRGVQKLELSIGTEACVCPRALTDSET